MKIKSLLYITLALFLGTACQDKLEEEFFNPEQYEASPEKLAPGLFTKTLYEGQIYLQDYGEWWWALGGWSAAAYAQVALPPLISDYAAYYQTFDDITTGNGFSADSNLRSKFDNMNTRMSKWIELNNLMKNVYNEEEKKNAMVYYQLTTVIKDFVYLRNIDYFNSIPYYDALKGKDGELFPKYDDPKEVSMDILKELKDIATTLVSNYEALDEEGKELFAKQDIALEGDIQKWLHYVNALRLKYALRISGIEPEFAKGEIQSAIKGGLPTSDLTFEPPIEQAAVLPGGGTVVRAWYERFYLMYIPNVILERMNHNGSAYEVGIDDPRLPVIAGPTRYDDYRGCRMDNEFHQPHVDSVAAGVDSLNRPDFIDEKLWEYNSAYINNLFRNSNGDLKYYDINCLSPYSSATYMFCEFPVQLITLGEVNLLMAEVAARNLATGIKSADEYLKDAVHSSTDFWYYINSLSICDKEKYPRYFPKKPETDKIEQYAQFIANEYKKAANLEDQIEIIMQQKYIHLNLMDPNECWTELRRTRHPKLEPVNFPPHVSMVTPQVERIKYPESEELNNSKNFAKVKDQDNYTSPIFWVTPEKAKESFYQKGYIEVEPRTKPAQKPSKDDDKK